LKTSCSYLVVPLVTALIILILSCKKEYSYEGGDTDGLAHGSLKDDSQNCFVSVVKGTYYNGIAISDTNAVIITINVTHPGMYNIQTEKSNGFQFMGSGTISDTGIQVITLTASGTPTLIKQTDFTLHFDGSVCQMSVSVADSASLHAHEIDKYPDTAWQFDSKGKRYFGFATRGSYSMTFYETYTDTTVLVEGFASTGYGRMQIAVKIINKTIVPGINFTRDATVFQYDSVKNRQMAFLATPLLPPLGIDVNTTVVITAFDKDTKMIYGTFDGTAVNGNYGSIKIENGRFKARVY
jgi:hypothetical protein